MASDDDFVILRRFDLLHMRMLLTLQDHLAVLEADLRAMDQRLSSRAAPDIHNGSIRHDQPERVAILNRIQSKMTEYGKI